MILLIPLISLSSLRKTSKTSAFLLLFCHALMSYGANPGEIFIDPGANRPLTKDGAGQPDLGTYPRLDWEFLLVLENTHLSNISSGQGKPAFSHVNYLDPIVQNALEIKLTQQLGIYALSQAKSFADGDKDRVFSGVDGQLLNLFLAYQSDSKDDSFFGGKFDVGFGDAWHNLDGVYSGFAGDYHYQGALGVGARQVRATGWGKIALTEILFKRDHGVTRDTWFEDRPQVRQDSDENGLANTAGLQSGGLSYEMTEIPGLKGLRLNTDIGRVAQGYPGHRDMLVYAGTLDYRRELSSNLDMRLYAELVHANGFAGKDLQADHATLSASLTTGRTTWTATGSRRRFSTTSGDLAAQGIVDRVDHGVSAAVTYASEWGPIVQAGIARQYAQSLAVTQVTLRLIYQLSR